jgi:hypothetical protein
VHTLWHNNYFAISAICDIGLRALKELQGIEVQEIKAWETTVQGIEFKTHL